MTRRPEREPPSGRPLVVVITGPTATGKTALGVEVALRAPGEVISADSMQIYRGMDIGTAKPGPEELRGTAHHMLSVADPAENWSVARWADEAARVAAEILERGRIPLVVGGTGQYIDALLSGTDFADAPGDSGLRESLTREYDELGGEAFRRRLSAVDPDRAAKLAPADRKRLVRAMEVYLLTGQTITEHDRLTATRPPRFDSVRYALTYRDRETLYERIRLRVDDMIRRGLFEETEALLASGVSPGATAMQAIGYKEAAAALRGECTREEAAERIKRASTRYAKRQLTWLRRDTGLRWVYREEAPDLTALAEEICRDLPLKTGKEGSEMGIITENVLAARERIAEAAAKAGRDPASVRLLAATKMNGPEAVREAVAAGVDICAENRVQEFLEKNAVNAYEGCDVHFIGHLQKNKVKYLVGAVSLIHSVDSEGLLREIDRRAAVLGITQDVLLEVNIGGEKSKSGVSPDGIEALIACAGETSHVRVTGLMTIPPEETQKGDNLKYFRRMYDLFVDIRRKKYNNVIMNDLSMGMSSDYAEAVCCGATIVRLGTALFGPRNYN